MIIAAACHDCERRKSLGSFGTDGQVGPLAPGSSPQLLILLLYEEGVMGGDGRQHHHCSPALKPWNGKDDHLFRDQDWGSQPH